MGLFGYLTEGELEEVRSEVEASVDKAVTAIEKKRILLDKKVTALGKSLKAENQKRAKELTTLKKEVMANAKTIAGIKKKVDDFLGQMKKVPLHQKIDEMGKLLIQDSHKAQASCKKSMAGLKALEKKILTSNTQLKEFKKIVSKHGQKVGKGTNKVGG